MILKKIIHTLRTGLIVLSVGLMSFQLNEVSAASNYLAITNTQMLDISYPIVQIQTLVKIEQVRVGNNVVNDVDGWSAWADITDSFGTPIPGGLLFGSATIKDWLLPPTGENNSTKVCVQLKDANGNISAWNSNCKDVYWDTLAPTPVTYTFNNNNTWDNDWVFPVNISLSDPVGVSTYTGLTIDENGGMPIDLFGTSCLYNDASSVYDCLYNGSYSADVNQGMSTFTLKYRDNLNNEGISNPIVIRFDEKAPTGMVSITKDTASVNLVNIAYSIVDVAGKGGASGIKTITIENVTNNPVNANKEVIYSTNIPEVIVVNNTKAAYEITEQLGTVKMTIEDFAGNIKEIYSNTVSANRVAIESTIISKVVNPIKYPNDDPFTPLSINAKIPLLELPEAMAGGNIFVSQNYYWDPEVTDVTGFYQFAISTNSGTIHYETIQFDLNDIAVNGNSAVLNMQTMIDELIPIGTQDNPTHISLQIEMYVTLNGVTDSIPIYFPAKNTFYKIASITGSIEESINFDTK